MASVPLLEFKNFEFWLHNFHCVKICISIQNFIKIIMPYNDVRDGGRLEFAKLEIFEIDRHRGRICVSIYKWHRISKRRLCWWLWWHMPVCMQRVLTTSFVVAMVNASRLVSDVMVAETVLTTVTRWIAVRFYQLYHVFISLRLRDEFGFRSLCFHPSLNISYWITFCITCMLKFTVCVQ